MSISNRKVVIVGAGHVGSHVGYALISQSLADEIVYIDSDHAKAVAQAFDLTDATNYLPVRTKVTAGDYSDAKDAQIMIISAGPLPTGNQTTFRFLSFRRPCSIGVRSRHREGQPSRRRRAFQPDASHIGVRGDGPAARPVEHGGALVRAERVPRAGQDEPFGHQPVGRMEPSRGPRPGMAVDSGRTGARDAQTSGRHAVQERHALDHPPIRA